MYDHSRYWKKRFHRAHKLLLKCLDESDMLSVDLQLELKDYMATILRRKTRKRLYSKLA